MKPRIDRAESDRSYLEGRRCCRHRTQGQLQKALDCFRRASELDPTSARAFSGLADAYILLHTYHLMPFEQAYQNAKEAAGRALELDDRLAEAHASSGQVKATFEKDWEAAQQEFAVALELDPDCVTAHHWRAGLLMRAGQHRDALREVEAAIEVDPTHTVLLTSRAQLNSRLGNWDEALSGFEEALVTDPGNEAIRINLALLLAQTGDTDRALAVIRDALELAPQSHFVRGVYATILYYSRQYDLAIEQIEAAADMLAQLPPMAHLVLGLACLQKGSYQRALDAFAQASQPSGNYTGETDLSRVAAYARAITQARMGNSESARDALRRLGSEPSEIAQEPCWRGLLCFALGETADGFDWLETAHRNGDMWVRYLKVQPLFDPLRSDPRFATLLERIALQRGAHPPANA